MQIMKKHYTVIESWVKGIKDGKFIEPLIPKGSGIVVISEINEKVKFFHQGHSICEMSYNDFQSIPKVESNFDYEFICKYIIPGEDITNVKKLFQKLRKYYKNSEFILKVLNTVNTWIFSTKGSSAIKGKEYWSLDFNNLPWVKNSGFSTKPYSWWENRSGRTTIVPSELFIETWVENPTDVLPIGIKSNEHCTYFEMVKIAEKLFQELCGIEGIDTQFKNIVKEFFPNIKLEYVHKDFMTGERIKLNMFEKNTHHGKIKGLELCHKDPSLIYATNHSNITIGLSDSNRRQSGNSIEEMAINGVNSVLIKMGKTPITKEFLNTILESI